MQTVGFLHLVTIIIDAELLSEKTINLTERKSPVCNNAKNGDFLNQIHHLAAEDAAQTGVEA